MFDSDALRRLRALEKADWVAEHVCAEVPHRQFVFTIPKRLRIYFRFERRLLGELITVYRAASGRPDAVPGMVGAIQTFGQLIHWHPHIHALVTEEVVANIRSWRHSGFSVDQSVRLEASGHGNRQRPPQPPLRLAQPVGPTSWSARILSTIPSGRNWKRA